MDEFKERVSYFYELDVHGQLHPKLTVAFVTAPDGRTGIGVALRSNEDQPSKGVGRTLATIRARAALATETGVWGTPKAEEIVGVAINAPHGEFARSLLRQLRDYEGWGIDVNLREWDRGDEVLSDVWTWDLVRLRVIGAALDARGAS